MNDNFKENHKKPIEAFAENLLLAFLEILTKIFHGILAKEMKELLDEPLDNV